MLSYLLVLSVVYILKTYFQFFDFQKILSRYLFICFMVIKIYKIMERSKLWKGSNNLNDMKFGSQTSQNYNSVEKENC